MNRCVPDPLPLYVLMLCSALFGVLACSGEPASPEDQIREMISRAEIAIEARDVKPVKNMISESYRDSRGRDKNAIKGVLAAHLLRNRAIHLLIRIAEIEISDDGRAHTLIFVAMTGVPIESPEALVTVTGHLYRVEVDLISDGDQWQVVSARERPAGAADFIGP